ncbi:MAG: hypothetical protein K2K83_06615, partial [Rikenella sp.]|nr:hypothetical protein [Rikenella sp.]
MSTLPTLPARWQKSYSKAIHAFERFPTPALARGISRRKTFSDRAPAGLIQKNYLFFLSIRLFRRGALEDRVRLASGRAAAGAPAGRAMLRIAGAIRPQIKPRNNPEKHSKKRLCPQ